MLRADAGHVNALGLFDLDGNIRPVGRAYCQLIADWSAILPTQSHCLTLPLDLPEAAGATPAERLRRNPVAPRQSSAGIPS